ncbi:hypothetical protein [Vibrio parahaemolyticus]|uniref:hypothetical protein n=1 Tax=Vibrio parahaemolyticus TaxID=670 RepID=UPI00344F88F8|nr:ATP-binding protein [Vibrio parahaemolyticus]
MLRYTDFFSRKIAKNRAFFDRFEERRSLMTELSSSSSVWLSGERRVGKTSMAIHVCTDIASNPSKFGIDKFVWSDCDISSCPTIDAVKRKVLHSIAEAASELTDGKEDGKNYIKNLFSRFDPEFALGGRDLAKVTLKLKAPVVMDSPLEEALLSLDQLAAKCNARVALIIDEFQTLSEINLSDGEKVEWDIRGGLQRSERVSMIFAGSKRRMMSDVFMSRNRGLYGMCRRISVFELPEDECLEHLKVAAKDCGYTYDEDALPFIAQLTSGHPRDFSHLCLQVFENATFYAENTKHITRSLVEESWLQYVKCVVIDEVESILKEKLNANKRAEVATLQAIAHTRPKSVRSADFCVLTGLTATPIYGALKNLDEQGLIRKNSKEQWCLCEPSYETALKIISEHHFDHDMIAKVKKANEV